MLKYNNLPESLSAHNWNIALGYVIGIVLSLLCTNWFADIRPLLFICPLTSKAYAGFGLFIPTFPITVLFDVLELLCIDTIGL